MPIFDKNTARIKMVALTKGEQKNITWYSLAKFDEPGNGVSDTTIIKKMLSRIKGKPEMSQVMCIQFYDNQTKQLIEEYK
ncbi:hypothetical protein [Flavobacterium sp. AG291]|uniref:hypothetical protein n=1 Tax=Flavobacterium sp. AG291 TaxID=2184000 RepID=UPI000E0C07D1|nr:hypothetical protein [Flavobacterium sp. AG291]RDI07064.1 hypothetical protein DEU42_113164 [Flavobacterium sp. AG291]